MVVWLASYPRSGNTFFRVLMNHLYNVKTYSIYDDSLLNQIGASETVGHEALPAPVEELAKSPEFYLVKTHGEPTDSGPAVYLVRDGRDAVVSYARYRMSFDKKDAGLIGNLTVNRRFRQELKNIILGESPFGSWGDHVRHWNQLRADGRSELLRFE